MVSSPFGGIHDIDEALFHEVFAKLNIGLEGKHILDVGCGRGFVGDFVRERGGTYTGLDFVVSRKGFPLVQAEASLLPFHTGTFDGVFCIDMFEHLPAPRLTTLEFKRVLRPSGFVFLSAPNYSNMAGVVKKVAETVGGYTKNTWAPFGRWQPQELEQPITGAFVRRMYRRGGFSRFTRMGYGSEVGLGLFPWMDHISMPEAIQYRLQRFFGRVGPGIAKVWPGASLHSFWKIEA